MPTLTFQQVPRDEAALYKYANPLIESWLGVANKGVPLTQTQVNDVTKYAGDFENADTTGSPTRKSLRAVAGTHSLLVNGNGITLSSATITGTLSAGTTTLDTLILPFKTVGSPTDPGSGLSRLYAGDDGNAYWFPNGGAAIKLLRSGLVVNADIAAGAAIALTKLAPGAANTVVLTNGAGTALTTALLVNANVDAAAAIAYTKLALTGSLVNADVSGSAAIAYSKLNLATSIVNADINASAAIAVTKLAAGANNQILWNSGGTNQWTSSPTIGGTLDVAGKITGGAGAEIDGTFEHTGSSFGVYNIAPVSRATVTGSRGGNAALLDLITKLENVGLIVNGTSA